MKYEEKSSHLEQFYGSYAVWCPFDFPVTSPVLLTVAIFVLLLFHTTCVEFPIVCAFNCVVFPVPAVGKGTATITAKANGKLAKAKVTVKDPYANVSPTSGTIKVGKTLQLTTNYAPASTGTPSYSSSNKKVATVDSKGVVKGVKAGTATITVKVNGVTAKAEITVK